MSKKYFKYLMTTIVVVIMVTVFSFFIDIAFVRGDSMEPKLFQGDRVIVFKHLGKNCILTGDIIVFKWSEKEYCIKSIFGKPEDLIVQKRTLSYSDDSLLQRWEVKNLSNLNQVDFEEVLNSFQNTSPRKFDTYHRIDTSCLSAEQVYVLGKNLANSNDSRYYGPIDLSLIYGKVLWKIEIPFIKSSRTKR